MEVAADIVALLLAAAMGVSAFGKLIRMEPVVAALGKAGVPDGLLPTLATIQIVGAIGLVVGLWLAWAGVVAGFGFFAYFVLAVGFHLRARDTAGAGVPAFLGLVGLAAALLRLAA